MTHSAAGHWPDLASRWDAIGSPLRPTTRDVDEIVQLAEALPGDRRRCLVLGATREFCEARWPSDTDLLAIDRSGAMVAALWDRSAGPPILADWRALPLRTASVDLIVCDGGWHLLGRGADQGRLAEEAARVLRPGGFVAVRLFASSPAAVDTKAVLAMLAGGVVEDANHLKVLLWMAVRDPEGTVAVADVWSVLTGAHPDLDGLAHQLGWPTETLRAFEAYRGSTDHYHLIDSDELGHQLATTGAFEPAAFHEGVRLAPDLRFPTIVHRRTP